MARSASGTGCAEGKGGRRRRIGSGGWVNRSGMVGTGGMVVSCGGGGGEKIRCLLSVGKTGVSDRPAKGGDWTMNEPLWCRTPVSCSSSLSIIMMVSEAGILEGVLLGLSMSLRRCDGLCERRRSSSSIESTTMTSIIALVRISGITGTDAIGTATSTLAMVGLEEKQCCHRRREESGRLLETNGSYHFFAVPQPLLRLSHEAGHHWCVASVLLEYLSSCREPVQGSHRNQGSLLICPTIDRLTVGAGDCRIPRQDAICEIADAHDV